MKHINVFYQVEGIHAQQHVEAPPEELLVDLKLRIATKHEMSGALVLYLEDSDEVVDETLTIGGISTEKGAKLHLHRCTHVGVSIAFSGRTLEHSFGPGATIARVKHWAADKLGMSKDDASEHVLQIAGTHDRPTPSTHLGALVKHPHCKISFDLVPDERVNG